MKLYWKWIIFYLVLILGVTFLVLYQLFGFKYYLKARYYLYKTSESNRLLIISDINKAENEGIYIGIYGFRFGDRIAIWGVKGLNVFMLSKNLNLNFNKKDCLMRIVDIKNRVQLESKNDLENLFKMIIKNSGYMVEVKNIYDNDFINKNNTLDLTVPKWWSSVKVSIDSKCGN